MPNIFKIKRITSSQLSAVVAVNGFIQGEPFLVTDQNRIGIGLSTNTYELYAKVSEASGGTVKGTAIIDFGVNGDTETTVTVPCVSVAANSVIITSLSPLGTVDNDADEHLVENTLPKVSKKVVGVSFDITMLNSDIGLLYGTWLIEWTLV